MTDALPPPAVFIFGACLVPLLKGRAKQALLLFLPAAGMLNLFQMPSGLHGSVQFAGFELVLGRVDRLSLLFGLIFHMVTFIAVLYALHIQDNLQHAAGLVYAGSALGVVFAGDLLSFFVFWEMLTVSSVFLIWSQRTAAALGAGYRYLLVHAAGGLVLLAGIVLHVHGTGSTAFGTIGLHSTGAYLIFIGFGVNCAWPFLHPWLTDAYPEATITGTIFLSAFTTKSAVYALARAFSGTEALIWIGALMTAFPIFYAVIENDLRRVLAYSLINQVGFMVCGIGIGTPLAINGAVAHAFNDILFKALLFMSMGAVMYRTGKINATALGGLHRTMPLTCIFCIVGAASISAFPLFSGFVSKSMVMDAAASGHLRAVWFILLFASAGVFHHAGIKIPYFAFFSHDAGLRPKEAPAHMLLAMGITAGLCLFIGVYPWPLYNLLPYPDVFYQPYTAGHVLAQSQLLFFSALAFTLLLLSGIYPAEMRAINLDCDWFYRKGGRWLLRFFDDSLNRLNPVCDVLLVQRLPAVLGRFAQAAPTTMVLAGLRPLLALRAGGASDVRKLRSALQDVFNTATAPLGISTALAVMILAMLYFLA